jgi:ribose transport system ATP-binding protein
VLDEPTASLPGADVERLFAAIRRLKARGVAILYVSHHLDEVFEIADEVTVLRDGERVATRPIGGLDHDQLIELMIGHRLERKRQTERERTGAGHGGLELIGACAVAPSPASTSTSSPARSSASPASPDPAAR